MPRARHRSILGFDGHRHRGLIPAINAALETPGRRWRLVDGPDSGCGQDYWLRSRNDTVYANVDQGTLICASFCADHGGIAS